MKMMAKTLYGLEDVLCQELEALGAQEIEKGRRVVYFEGDKRLLYKANFFLRTALRVLVPIASFDAKDADEVYDRLVEQVEWDQYLDAKSTFAVDTVVYSELFTHSKFVAYRCKDAIADFFSDKYGKRPNVSVADPDLLFHLHISHQTVTLALDSSGESLHLRGYRIAQTEAPINEVLAAGMLLKAGWNGETDFIDPMCGSGTILIEAALIARGMPAGMFRSKFAFERWKDFDAELFTEVSEEWEEKPFDHHIYGSDIAMQAVKIARANIANAGVSKYVTVEVKDVADYTEENTPKAPALLVTNPPYGERLRPESLTRVYGALGNRFKHAFTGYKTWVISSSVEGFRSLGLKHFSREKLFNGQIECEFRGYETFSGKRAEFLEEHGPRSRGRDRKEGHGYRERKPFAPRRSSKDERAPRSFSRSGTGSDRRRRETDSNDRFDARRPSKPRAHDSRDERSVFVPRRRRKFAEEENR